jgi:hypothetical protein
MLRKKQSRTAAATRFVALVSILFGGASIGLAAEHDNGSYAAAFERLKSLVGTWEYESRDGETREVVYSLTGEGSALIERFRDMSSVYHMDGDDLRVTHYCGVKNQPRMRAVAYEPAKGVLQFDFVDVTNVSDPDAYYTRQVRISFFDHDHAEVYFDGLKKGEASPVTIDLRRK